MKVLILGATGFIGLPAAKALARAGHEVYGQTRSAAKGAELWKEEIEPIVSDPNSDSKWVELVPKVDAIIDAIGGDADISRLALDNIKKAEEAAKQRHPTAARLTYIWTSGTWIHGDARNTLAPEGEAIDKAIKLTAWRPEVEQALVQSQVLSGTVIRPSLLYGRSASIVAMLFAQAKAGAISWPSVGAGPGTRWATIHADDLAECYRLAIEKAPLVRGHIIDCSNPYTESVDVLLHQIASIAGIPKEKISLREPSNPFEEALTITTALRPTLARSLLGWAPLKPSLVDGLAVYYKSWLAHQA